MRRSFFVVAAAVLLVGTGVAFAASLGLASTGVGAGTAPISRCDTDGFTVTTTAGTVTSVTVGDIADPACEGAQVWVTLTNAAGAQVSAGGPQTVATDGDTLPNSRVVAVSPSVTETSVVGIHVQVIGP